MRISTVCVLVFLAVATCTADDCPGGGKPFEKEKKRKSHKIARDDQDESDSDSCDKRICPVGHKCFSGKCCPPVNDFTVAMEIVGKRISVKRTDCIEGFPLKDSSGKNRVCGDFFSTERKDKKCPSGYECVEHLDHSVCCPPPGNATKRWNGSFGKISTALNFGLGCMMPFAANLGVGVDHYKKDPNYRSRFDDLPDLSNAYGVYVGSDSSGRDDVDKLVPGDSSVSVPKGAGKFRWTGRIKDRMCGYPVAKLDECINDKNFLNFDSCPSLGISAQNILQQLNIKCGRYPEYDNSTLAGTECIRAILNTTAGDKCVAENGQKGLEKEFVDGPTDGYPQLCGGLKKTFDCLEPLVKSNCKAKDSQKQFESAKGFYDSVFSVTFGTGCVLKGVGVY